MARFKGWVGSSYLLRNARYDAQRTINMYPEVDETQLGKNAEIAQLTRTPGLTQLVPRSGTDATMNAGFVTGDGDCFWVLDDGLYQLEGVDGSASGWTLTKKASFTHGPNVMMADNMLGPSRSLFIVANGEAWTYNTFTQVFAELEGPGGVLWQPTSCTFIDGYVVFSLANQNAFYWTDLYSNTVGSLNFASAEVNSDHVVGVINNNEDLWVFGKKTTEIWYDAAQDNVVFARRPGLLIELGCVSPTTVVKVEGNRIAWLGVNDRGGPSFVLTEGYSPIRISTYAMEQQWSTLSQEQLSRAHAFVYNQEGHVFIVLNIPGLSSTWVYDVSTSVLLGKPTWHERTYTDPLTGQQTRWRGEGHVFYLNRHIVSDSVTGAMYFLDQDGFTDNGVPITRQRVGPHISNDGKRLFYNWLAFDFKTGMGTVAAPNPSVMLEFSNDGGNTYSDVITRSLGSQGSYNSRVIFHQLGQGRDRVFRLTMTDPVDWALTGAAIDITPADH